MNQLRNSALVKTILLSEPNDILQLTVICIFPFVVIAALILPLSNETRLEIVFVIFTAVVYVIAIFGRFFPHRRTLQDIAPYPVAMLSVAFITFIIALLNDGSPFIATLYVIFIAAVASRSGLWFGIWSGLLASFGYLTLVLCGIARASIIDIALLTTIFILVGWLTGSMSQVAKRRQQEFENVVTRSHQGICIISAAGYMEYANPAVLALTNYRLEEIQGHHFLEWIIATDQALARRGWQVLTRRPAPNRTFNLHIKRKDGTIRTMATSLAILDPTTPRYMAIMRDITEEEIERAIYERRHRELDAERTVTRVISQTIDLREVMDLALDQTLAALQVDIAAIYLADDARTELTLAASKHLPDEMRAHVTRFRFGEGITGTAAAQRQAILIDNVREDPILGHRLLENILGSHISMPLIVDQCVVGVLNVDQSSRRHFNEDDLALLQTLSASMAIAIDRARMFERLEQRVAERTAELASLNRIAAAANQSLDLTRILNATLEEITRLFKIDGAWVRLLDPETNALLMVGEWGPSIHSNIRERAFEFGEGMSRHIVRDGIPHAYDLESCDLSNRDELLALSLHSIAAVPLILDGKAGGVLGVVSTERDRFGEAELGWLGAVGDTIAVGLKNARLFESVTQQWKRTATLREIDHALGSVLELPEMLHATLKHLAQVVPYDSAVVLLLDETRNILRAAAARGPDRVYLQSFALDVSNNAIFKEMVATQTAINIRDVYTHPDWVMAEGATLGHAWLGAPLIARGEVIGQIGLFSAIPGTFTREHNSLLLAFAGHAAIAIANARLRTELGEQARRDSLTQVLNHSAFIADLRDACDAALRDGRPLALIMLDLDNFKKYNDTYGHVVGDAVLTTTVQAIRAHIKQTDLVGRWGGEEFGIVLFDTDSAHAEQVAQRIRTTLSQIPILDRSAQPIPCPTASQGIAAIPETTDNADELIEQADRALYCAKNQGRDQVVVTKEKRQTNK